MSDPVNHPAHYTAGAYETIDVIEDTLSPEAYIGYLHGNAIKYVLRLRHKGKPSEDARKAAWYLERLAASLSCKDEETSHGR